MHENKEIWKPIYLIGINLFGTTVFGGKGIRILPINGGEKLGNLELKLFASGAERVALKGKKIDFVYIKTYDNASIQEGIPMRVLNYNCQNYEVASEDWNKIT